MDNSGTPVPDLRSGGGWLELYANYTDFYFSQKLVNRTGSPAWYDRQKFDRFATSRSVADFFGTGKTMMRISRNRVVAKHSALEATESHEPVFGRS